MRAVFRADASTALGGGHVMRCMTLEESLRALGWDCAFAVNQSAPETVSALEGRDVRVLGGSAAEQAETIRTFWPEGCDWLVVDHYSLDSTFEEACSGWARRVLVIDDLADRKHHCNVLLDQTFGRSATDYGGKLPAGTRLLAGSPYALLRPGFARLRKDSLQRRRKHGSVRRVLVSLGATDPENLSVSALQAIADSGLAVMVDVVLGGGAPHRQAVREQIAAMGQPVTLHVDTPEMPRLMAAADLAIGAAGTSTWERCCLGLPSLMLVVADNQRQVAAAVGKAGAVELVEHRGEALVKRLSTALCNLADDEPALQAMSRQAAAICDGRGRDRVTLSMVEPSPAKDGRPVSLRLAGHEDENLILAWQQHPTTRRFSRNPQPPTAAEHHAWFQTRLEDPDCRLTLITLDEEPAGVLRLDAAQRPRAAEAPAFEVSILVSPDHRGLGIAGEALAFLRRWQRSATIVAEVLAGNEASAALFRTAGYAPGADGLLYSRPPAVEPVLSL